MERTPRRLPPKAAGSRLSSTRCWVIDTWVFDPRSINWVIETSEPTMNHFDYRNGVLHAEAVNLAELAAAVGTPFYCYSTATLERHYRVFTEAFPGEKVLVCYAMKANSNQPVLRTLAKHCACADVRSDRELNRALPPRI